MYWGCRRVEEASLYSAYFDVAAYDYTGSLQDYWVVTNGLQRSGLVTYDCHLDPIAWLKLADVSQYLSLLLGLMYRKQMSHGGDNPSYKL